MPTGGEPLPPAPGGATATAEHTGRQGALLKRALAPVQADLAAVTERVLAELTEPVARQVVYLVSAGGKRLRPALVLLAGASGGRGERPALIETAASIELIHTATLIHDDIIDESPLRRAQPSFHARWGIERAVLMGDYLYASAFTLLARLQAPLVMQIMADVCRELCRGELLEVEARFRIDLSEAEYFSIIRDKTASLIGGCCQAGATLGGCRPESVAALREFGLSFGLAFQIIDDCLDLTGDAEELGKSVLSDLDQGALSLPIIYLTQMLPEREREALFAPLREAAEHRDRPEAARRAKDPVFLAAVAQAARSRGAIAKAEARAQALLQQAQDALAASGGIGLLEVYEQLAAYAVSRRS